MKKNIKKRISLQEEKLLFRVVLALLLVAGLWIVFSPGTGLISLKAHRSNLAQLKQEISELEKENHTLQVEMDRLQNDPEYLEEVARKEYGLLRRNERVYDFSKNSPQKGK